MLGVEAYDFEPFSSQSRFLRILEANPSAFLNSDPIFVVFFVNLFRPDPEVKVPWLKGTFVDLLAPGRCAG